MLKSPDFRKQLNLYFSLSRFFPQIILLKKAVNKFRGQISDGLSSTSENVRCASPRLLREHLINRLSSAKTMSAITNINNNNNSGGGDTATASNIPPASTSASTSAPIAVHSATNVRTVEVRNRGQAAAAATAQRSNSLDHKGGQKWRLMRQKSQKMLKNISPTPTATVSEATAATTSGGGSSSSVVPDAAVATNIMHDFNLSMSEYRSEIRENIAHLDEKINRLEAAIRNLTEKMPLLVLQQTGQQLSRAKDNARK